MKSFGLFVVIVFGIVLPSFSSASGIDDYFGVFESKFKVEYESENGPVFKDGFQKIEIKRVARSRTSYEVDNGRIPATITVNAIGVNGHTCSYDGTGWWDKTSDRFEFADDPKEDDEQIACRLVVIIKNSSAYTVTQSKGCESACGMRNSLDGYVLKKSVANKW